MEVDELGDVRHREDLSVTSYLESSAKYLMAIRRLSPVYVSRDRRWRLVRSSKRN
jgi:hypothetical protein